MTEAQPATNQAPKNIAEIVQLAEQSEAQGVPVNWKAMTYNILTAAQQSVGALEQELAKANEKIAEHENASKDTEKAAE